MALIATPDGRRCYGQCKRVSSCESRKSLDACLRARVFCHVRIPWSTLTKDPHGVTARETLEDIFENKQKNLPVSFRGIFFLNLEEQFLITKHGRD